MKTTFDDIEIELTEGYIEAVKNLMREQMKMMRTQLTPDCWAWARASIGDLSQAQSIVMDFGSDAEKPDALLSDDVMITIADKKPPSKPLPNLPMCNALSAQMSAP